MNKKIASEMAVGIILILVVVVGGVFYLQSNYFFDISLQKGNKPVKLTFNSKNFTISDSFKNYIPTKFNEDLLLVDLGGWTSKDKFREVDIINTSTGDKTTKRISVDDGYRAMYSYPNTEYFANVKVERSVKGEFEKDKATVIESVKNYYDFKLIAVKQYTENNPELQKNISENLATGHEDYITFEDERYNGYEYVSYVKNIIDGGTISQVEIFVPEDSIIITAYLLNQKNPKFKNADEFLALRNNFIHGYIDFIVSTKSGI